MLGLALTGLVEGGGDEVADVIVCEPVVDVLAVAPALHDAARALTQSAGVVAVVACGSVTRAAASSPRRVSRSEAYQRGAAG